MGNTYSWIDERLAQWIAAQHMFFVATAPDDPDDHINLSPKGLDCFRIVDPVTVAFLDLTGSGIETVAHLKQNGRITIMFCAFDGAPKILRLYGKGEVVDPTSDTFASLRPLFPALPGERSIIRVRLTRIADSCGFGVPLMKFESERNQLIKSAEKKGEEGLREYRVRKNAESIDGLPGL